MQRAIFGNEHGVCHGVGAWVAGSIVLALSIGGCAAEVGEGEAALVGGREEVVVDGNPSCVDLGFDYEVKPDELTPGETTVLPVGADGDAIALTVDADRMHFHFSSDVGIEAVIANGGSLGATVYYYDPPTTDDWGLHAPVNPDTDTPWGLSDASFCFDLDLRIQKSAVPTFDRIYDWTIEKVGPEGPLTLATLQSYLAHYEVWVERLPPIDKNFTLYGEVKIYNPSPFDATIVSIVDQLEVDGGPTPVTLECGVELPYVLESGTYLVCPYEAHLDEGLSGQNVVVVQTAEEGMVDGGSAAAPFEFGSAAGHVVDGCVTVEDSLFVEPLGFVCGSQHFSYQHEVGLREVCGSYEVFNEATATTDRTGSEHSDTHLLEIDVPCVTGCTLTPGYWKTHSIYGPAPYDSRWDDLEDVELCDSGMTHLELLSTPPRGNGYLILARAAVAAWLNVHQGEAFASPEVLAALDEAMTLLCTWMPSDLDKRRENRDVRARMIELAMILDDYDNGELGTPHCDEDQP